MPELPRDITTTSDADLMERFREFVEWQNYASSMLVEKEVEEEKAERTMKFLEGQKMLQQWDDKGTVTKQRAEVSQDPEVEKARQNHLQKYAERKYTKMIYENCERSAALISRELSRRIGRDGTERRNMRWSA